ncbi:hypothetical protein NA56DRAFT_242457 [Hyaloscypha hepaticicola]|uniref:Uncharacterized protein n=1 Tax=Hyaloscypha hepaticicola TaxID=2082293 RepID=A0A2J6PXJ0_9HELO|nr:hypothetical protein NA56DRAFT_242457 [Hyaloscypha hepaticicola]
MIPGISTLISYSKVNIFILSCNVSPMHLIPILLALNPASIDYTYSRVGTCTEIELLPVHLREEAFLHLFLTMLGHWRNAGRVLLPLNLWKIHFQHLPSFLHASKHYSSTGSHLLLTPVLRPYSSLLEHPLLSLLRSGSLSLKPLLSLLLDGSLLYNIRAWIYVALIYLDRVRVASL